MKRWFFLAWSCSLEPRSKGNIFPPPPIQTSRYSRALPGVTCLPGDCATQSDTARRVAEACDWGHLLCSRHCAAGPPSQPYKVTDNCHCHLMNEGTEAQRAACHGPAKEPFLSHQRVENTFKFGSNDAKVCTPSENSHNNSK